jgi:hypothetical protein
LLGRGQVLATERQQLVAALADAQANFGGTVAQSDQIKDLTAQIEELNVSLVENSAALISNTVSARQAAIDAITGRGSFMGGVFGGLTSIVQAAGVLTGTLDVGRLLDIAQRAGDTLRSTGEGLRDQLASGFGLDLHGIGGQSLVDVLKSLNFTSIETSFTVEQKQQFESLIGAIIDNEQAVQQNTQSVRDLTQTQTQSFSSSAWQLFRQAIFTGSGGLLPQYRVPMMASGGTILTDGMIYAHAGEILPARVTRDLTQRDGDTIVNVTSPTEVLDPGYVGTVLAFRRSIDRATR